MHVTITARLLQSLLAPKNPMHTVALAGFALSITTTAVALPRTPHWDFLERKASPGKVGRTSEVPSAVSTEAVVVAEAPDSELAEYDVSIGYGALREIQPSSHSMVEDAPIHLFLQRYWQST